MPAASPCSIFALLPLNILSNIIFYPGQVMTLPSKRDFALSCHYALDTESGAFRRFWMPAFAGMTISEHFRLLTISSRMIS
jgi:hypothetical protein